MTVRLSVSVAALAALLLPGAGVPLTGAQTPTFRSSTTVVSVTAVVRDRKGRFVRDLEKKDFVVAESGRQKPILDFRAESDGPVRLALLFDVSGSMRVASRAVDARQAARHVLSALRPSDEAALFAFDTRLSLVRGFTSDIDSLIASLDRVDAPYGQTSLYDAVAETARSVAAEKPDRLAQVQRRAVVVLTDGIDTKSRLTAADVSGIASSIDVPVYVLAVMHSVDDPRDERTEAGDSALRNLAYWTGGDLFISTAPAHASVAARRIVDELRHQYVMAVEGSGLAGWHALEVRARDRDLVVRARAGYMASGGATVP
jgi:VWFA-related protein